MRTFRRPSRVGRLGGFGLVDTLVGILLLAVTAGFLASGVSTVLTVDRKVLSQWDQLIQIEDRGAYGPWF
jgi:hypothetical protein